MSNKQTNTAEQEVWDYKSGDGKIYNAYDGVALYSAAHPVTAEYSDETIPMTFNVSDEAIETMTREDFYEAMAEIEDARTVDAILAAAATVGVTTYKDGFNKDAPIFNFFNVEDPTVMRVLRKYEERHQEGMVKYGTTMADNNGNLKYWLRMAQEESMDLTLYLQRAIEEIEKQEVGVVV